MKKYNLAKRQGAYQKAPSGPRRGHVERARIEETWNKDIWEYEQKDMDCSWVYCFSRFFFLLPLTFSL